MATSKTKKKPVKKRGTIASTEFMLQAPEASEVFLLGDFNAWSGDGFKMRRFKDGTYKKKVKLKPGRYEYRFVVDGNWWTDPQNNERSTNPYGEDNSVILVG